MKNKYQVAIQTEIYSYENIDFIEGFMIKPKNNNSNYLTINKLVILKPEFVQKIIEKKIKRKVELYTNALINLVDNDDEDGIREALDDVARFKPVLENKYRKFLKENYYNLLEKKLNNIYGKLKEKEANYIVQEEKELEVAEKSK